MLSLFNLLTQFSALVESCSILDPWRISDGVNDLVAVDIDTVGVARLVVLVGLVGAIGNYASGNLMFLVVVVGAAVVRSSMATTSAFIRAIRLLFKIIKN